MVSIFVQGYHRESDASRPTGVRFTAVYDEERAKVVILEKSPVSDPMPLSVFCEGLHRLGAALQEAARSPQCIFWQQIEEPPEQQP